MYCLIPIIYFGYKLERLSELTIHVMLSIKDQKLEAKSLSQKLFLLYETNQTYICYTFPHSAYINSVVSIQVCSARKALFHRVDMRAQYLVNL